MTRLDGIDVSQVPDRLLAKIDLTSAGCWNWTGAKLPTGHGTSWYQGTFHGAHRLMWQLLIGPIPHGIVLHHKCGNPSCVNPAHLDPLTRKQHAAEHGLTGQAAVHAEASCCVHGHPFDVVAHGRRICRTCARNRGREWARAKRAELRGDHAAA